jgi:hypothetical protein
MKYIAFYGYFLLTVLFSCQSEVKFDKIKWRIQEDPAFPPSARKQMLNDLLTNYRLNQMNKSQIIDLLGTPDFSEDSLLLYRVEEDYGSDIDLVYTKQLEVKLKPDLSVMAVEVHEWKK